MRPKSSKLCRSFAEKFGWRRRELACDYCEEPSTQYFSGQYHKRWHSHREEVVAAVTAVDVVVAVVVVEVDVVGFAHMD